MIVTTTPTLQGHDIVAYHGVVMGEAILGTNIFRDFFASITDIFGGRSGSYERVLNEAREHAINEMIQRAQFFGANAVVGVDIDYESISQGQGDTMLMVSASGTAVSVRAPAELAHGGPWSGVAGAHDAPQTAQGDQPEEGGFLPKTSPFGRRR